MLKPISNFIKSITTNDSQDLISNRYKLKRLLGKGAMGEVYYAEDTTTGNTPVAIKFLGQSLLDEKMASRFKNEARISALLGEQNQHIVKVKDYGIQDKKQPFYVMEFLEGNTLDKIIKNKVLSQGRFLHLIRQICLGLETAHYGIIVKEGELSSIIHRDIKPGNIFVTQEPTLGEFVKILDFGIAQVVNPLQSGTQSFMGTMEYCSPEQMAEKTLDATSDIYSLGIMMYEMVTGEIPITTERTNFKLWYDAHHNQTPKSLPSYLNLPSELQTLIMQCLEKSPQNRPQSMREILQVINPLNKKYNAQDDNFEKSNNSDDNLSLKDIYLSRHWPSDKPQNKIVFPINIETLKGSYSSIWTMLEKEEIDIFNSKSTFCYNHFLFQNKPHPMLLWINLLYVNDYQPKWLPSYLDLKTSFGYKVLTNLINTPSYHILLFALNQPQQYQQIFTIELPKGKKQQLEMYLKESNSWQGEKVPQISKKKLKDKFEQMKDTIMLAITKSQSNVKNN